MGACHSRMRIAQTLLFSPVSLLETWCLIDFIQYNAIEDPDKVGGKIKLRHPILLSPSHGHSVLWTTVLILWVLEKESIPKI